MNTPLKHYTTTAVERLRDTVETRLDWYYDPREHDVDPILTATDAVRDSRLEVRKDAAKLKLILPDDVSIAEGESGNPTGAADAESALAVYDAFSILTPQQAADERLWTYLCHVEYPKYVSRRWLSTRPAENDDAVRKVRNHFFARGNRPLIRDNGLSRLWWLGSIANEVEPDAPHEFLTRLLHRQDVRSALIERPSVSMNRQVLRAINAVMREYWQRNKSLFERRQFRAWMIGLNRRGGVVLLDALPSQPLAELLEDEASRAVSAVDTRDARQPAPG